MDSVTFYSVNDFGPVMKGMVIGGIGILHVFLAQFAIGGGCCSSTSRTGCPRSSASQPSRG